MKIKYSFYFRFSILFIGMSIPLFSQQKGESDFKQLCSACHTIGKGKLVGPDLANVQQRRSEDWIIKFVHSSQTLIKQGDAYADSLFKAYNQVPMPDQAGLKDDQIKYIIAYIISNSPGAGNSDSTTAMNANAPTNILPIGDIQNGKNLFVGNVRFTNGGPTCNSCHNVEEQGFITGGALAKDLTKVVSRLTIDGVKGVISGMPFPQMKQSYLEAPLTVQEIDDITAFLKEVNDRSTSQVSSNVGNKMLLGGASGIATLLVFFSIFWINRKKRTVNYEIYERQIKSQV